MRGMNNVKYVHRRRSQTVQNLGATVNETKCWATLSLGRKRVRILMQSLALLAWAKKDGVQ